MRYYRQSLPSIGNVLKSEKKEFAGFLLNTKLPLKLFLSLRIIILPEPDIGEKMLDPIRNSLIDGLQFVKRKRESVQFTVSFT